MKIKMLIVSALAGLAVSGLFAPTAGAEKMQEFAACGPFPAEEEAYLSDPSRTMQEIKEAWEVNKVRYCATIVLPAAEADELAYFVDDCLEPQMPNFTKAEAEACIAAWVAQNGNAELRHRNAKRKAKGKRHKAKQPRASIALARALS